jgi:hypothetical protein
VHIITIILIQEYELHSKEKAVKQFIMAILCFISCLYLMCKNGESIKYIFTIMGDSLKTGKKIQNQD